LGGWQPEGQGFKSPILHFWPFAEDRKWLFSSKLWRFSAFATSNGDVASRANPAIGEMIPPSPASTTGLDSNFVTADAPSPDSTTSPLTGDGANWLNDTESRWVGLSAALDVLNA
jgi:hypothetical protein